PVCGAIRLRKTKSAPVRRGRADCTSAAALCSNFSHRGELMKWRLGLVVVTIAALSFASCGRTGNAGPARANLDRGVPQAPPADQSASRAPERWSAKGLGAAFSHGFEVNDRGEFVVGPGPQG